MSFSLKTTIGLFYFRDRLGCMAFVIITRLLSTQSQLILFILFVNNEKANISEILSVIRFVLPFL